MLKYYGSFTDIGLKRKVNEDAIISGQSFLPDSPIEFVLMVADGMGGHNCGEIASGEAERIIKNLFLYGEYIEFSKKEEIDPSDFAELLRSAFYMIDKSVRKNSIGQDADRLMGTTCTVALILKKSDKNFRRVIIGHVGDSRAYIVSNDGIRLLTQDDSLVWEYYTRGMIEYDEIRTHKDRNVITQALGGDSLKSPMIFEEKLKNEDLLLLSSDGLHGVISDGGIKSIVNSKGEIKKIGHGLIQAALKSGGRDNISVAIFSEKEPAGLFSKIKLKYLAAVFIVIVLSGLGVYFYKIPSLKGSNNSSVSFNQSAGKTDERWKAFKVTTQKTNWNIGETGSFLVTVPVAGNFIVTWSNKSNSINKSVVFENKEIFLEEPFKKSGALTLDVILTKRENGINSDPRQVTFNVLEPEKTEQPNFRISRVGKTFVIDDYELLKKNIKSVNWNGNGQKQNEAGFKYDNQSDIPRYISIYLKNGRVEKIRIPK